MLSARTGAACAAVLSAPAPSAVTLPSWLPLQAIEDAAARLHGHLVRTPLLPVPGLLPGLWLKAETFQATGAFKERGALNRLLRLTPEQRRAGVAAMSAGNHAAGLARHAQRLGVRAVIVMPAGAPQCKIDRTRGFGAEVVLSGATVAEARGRAVELAAERGLTFVHPYDDADVIAGQGTVGLEIVDDLPTVDTVVVPVGGGGLLAGVAAAVKARRPGVRVIGVRHARYVGGPAPDGASLADGIAVEHLGALPLDAIESLGVEVVGVDETAIADAMATLHTRAGLVAEGAGAAAAAALLTGAVTPGPTTVAVVSGRNVDTGALTRLLQ
ncbi:threonine dehydratase [Azospirillum fermentarium]|uniref:pyridoxal-phosphate dependent enzyme n=1 Tax=Azospirillum fermentarium TaxID=1233114 RepID=UPI00222738AA|nr:pyridoxal-phosphate dependent enzyme [Azospirillum fermentarium]MCW2247319.1 threonine dehydratase [Azospirillum fermentarium]